MSATLTTPVAPWRVGAEPKTVEELYAIVNELCTKLLKTVDHRPLSFEDLAIGVLVATSSALHELTGCEGPDTDEEYAIYDATQAA